jgi:hypothetical protein
MPSPIKRPENSVPMPEPAYKVELAPAACALDLGVGSERAEYVSQDYVLRTLHRTHRSINLMYCYYPFDEGWPTRASVAFPPKEPFAWSYPYDDYFPYQGGSKGNTRGEPFAQMRDVRRHGQDVTLTLTLDCKIPDEELAVIARELAPFGHLRLRINHECDGNWFAFNKRYTHKEISAFFARFNRVLKREAPLVKTICCWGTLDKKTGMLSYADGLGPMLEHADIWSVDKYLSLHYAWPFNVGEPDQLHKGIAYEGVEYVWSEIAAIYEMFAKIAGTRKPLEICEFNADGDVGGREFQSALLRSFYGRVVESRPDFLRAITYYQFRDKGRLGLEQEDPNQSEVGIQAPFLSEYRALMKQRVFCPRETWTRVPELPPLVWEASDNSKGVGYRVPIPARPSFFELWFHADDNLVVRVGERYYHKRPGSEWVDATDAALLVEAGQAIEVVVFAPPADGSNPGSASSVTTRLTAPPELRLRPAWNLAPTQTLRPHKP